MCRNAVAKSGQHPAMLLMITSISHSFLFSYHYLRDLWGVCGRVIRCLWANVATSVVVLLLCRGNYPAIFRIINIIHFLTYHDSTVVLI